MAELPILEFPDPRLRTKATPVDPAWLADAATQQLIDDMFETMYEAPGIGLAAPQVGVQKRMFVYDIGDGRGPHTVINPVLSNHQSVWTYEEGCLSVPGLYWPIERAETVHLTGLDLDGNELDIEADELLARMFQHEVDHLDGVLLLERLTKEQRKDAMRELRRRQEGR
jgi:peptide deformylase